MDFPEIKELFDKYVIPTYKRKELAFIKGKGIYLWDIYDKKYMDLISGLGVLNLGHTPPPIIEAIKEGAEKIVHTSNLFYIPYQGMLAKKISEISFLGKTFFANSGAEAIECAIKVAKKYGNINNKHKIVALKNAFHGRTIGSLSITYNEKYRKPFYPLLSNVIFIEPNNIEEAKQVIDEDTAAIFVEGIQGEGGVYPLEKSFVQLLREISYQKKALLIFDEVQTGLGRTGKMFSYMHYDIEPDAITISKALGNGYPISAFHITEKYGELLSYGEHATTFGGNHLASLIGLKVIEEILQQNLIDKAMKLWEFFVSEIQDKLTSLDTVSEIRGMGLMIGIQLTKPIAFSVEKELIDKGFIVNAVKENIIRLLPPLIIEEEEFDFAFDEIISVLGKLA